MHVVSATNSSLFLGGAGGVTYFETTSKQYDILYLVFCNILGVRGD